MSDTFVMKDDYTKTENQKNHSKPILDIKSSNLSERTMPNIRVIISQKFSYSETQIESNVNYDDLCGAWNYPKNPVYNRYVEPSTPSICVWKYFTEEDITYLRKHEKNKELVYSFFENKFLNDDKGKSSDILVKELWEFFKFARLHSFTEKGVSAVLGLVYLTHLYFLSHPWWTAKEIYEFFHETILLHLVLNPPKRLEVFTMTEGNLLLKAFHEICMENLVLLHILCHPNYYFIMNLRNPASSVQKD